MTAAPLADTLARCRNSDALTALIREDATQSMPPYELWLRGRDDILGWWVGPGAGCPNVTDLARGRR